MSSKTFDDMKSDDIIDVRDIIERIEELDTDELNESIDNLIESDEATELVALREIMAELCGNGGDEQWKGDWYPVTLIKDSYFTEYAEELIKDCGDVPQNVPDYIAIDWDETAKNIQVDYTSIEIDGETYWYR